MLLEKDFFAVVTDAAFSKNQDSQTFQTACCKVHNTTVSVRRASGSGGYRAPVRTLPHGLDQLVDLLVVFQGVPQGVLGAEQPLPEAVHLRVQRRRVQHGVAPVIWRRAFPALEGARQEDSKRHRDGVSTFRFVDVCGFLSDDRFTSERRLPPSGIGEEETCNKCEEVETRRVLTSRSSFSRRLLMSS